MSTQGVGVWVLAATLMLAPDAASGAVLCAKQRSDGTFSSSVKIREACRAKEVLLAPEAVGFCCAASTTSTSTSSTSLACPTTTTLGNPGCVAGFGCGSSAPTGRCARIQAMASAPVPGRCCAVANTVRAAASVPLGKPARRSPSRRDAAASAAPVSSGSFQRAGTKLRHDPPCTPSTPAVCSSGTLVRRPGP